MRITALFLLLVTLAACDRAPAPDTATGSAGAASGSTPAAYDRSFLLLSDRGDAQFAAVVDYAALARPDSVDRAAGAWLLRGGAWDRLLALRWTGEPIRDAWRLVPHGPFRLIVGDAGDVAALVHRSDSTGFRLVPAPIVAEWTLGETAQLRLRQGELRLRTDTIIGPMLDLQIGIPISGEGRIETMFLTNGEGMHVVLARSGTQPAIVRLFRRQESLDWDGVSVTRLPTGATDRGSPAAAARGSGADGSASAPGWRIEATGDLSGELRAAGAELSIARPETGDSDVRVVVIRGWIEARGERHTVFGVLRTEQG